MSRKPTITKTKKSTGKKNQTSKEKTNKKKEKKKKNTKFRNNRISVLVQVLELLLQHPVLVLAYKQKF
jgi:hypothetical protein